VTTLASARRTIESLKPVAAEVPGAALAAVSLILVEGESGLETLLIRRVVRAGDPWSGQVAFPGGRRDPADPDLLVTAMREAREEVGVHLTAAESLGALDDLRPQSPTLPPVVVRPFTFGLARRPAIAISKAEVDHAFWLPLAALAAPGARRELTLMVRGAERTFQAYVIGDETIWGMTERILTPFAERLGVLR